MIFSEQVAVRTWGGWMALEDFCNSSPNGNGLMYTSAIVTMDEELTALELGARVANYMMQKDIDGWDALMDLSYAEYCARS